MATEVTHILPDARPVTCEADNRPEPLVVIPCDQRAIVYVKEFGEWRALCGDHAPDPLPRPTRPKEYGL